ncbi:MAG TPA: dihydroneopterin aldolase [Candidatus Paceibacterota bacterium]|nr:dihydroneopterin aldolase [Candidatus Paceibacterota bacterium]
MLTISIEGLTLWGKHGVAEAERAQKQPFAIDIHAYTSIAIDSLDDRINRTLDYGRFKEIAERVVEREEHQLIETIAYRIAVGVRERHHVRCVKVTVRKLQILPTGVPSVTVEL